MNAWIIRDGRTKTPIEIKLTLDAARHYAVDTLNASHDAVEFDVNNAWNIGVYVKNGERMPLEIVQCKLSEVVTRNMDLLKG